MRFLHMVFSAFRSYPSLFLFDRFVGGISSDLDRRFGRGLSRRLIRSTRDEFKRLAPEIPLKGMKPPFSLFLQATAIYLSLYRTLQKKGFSAAQTGRLAYDLSAITLDKFPAWLGGMFGAVIFQPRYIEKSRYRAGKSRGQARPGHYVADFVEGGGDIFDYGVDYLVCGGCEFLKAQGAFELAKYICPVDILYSQKWGWGLVRTTTLAEGSPRCDFRFKQGGETRVNVPEGFWEIRLPDLVEEA